MSEDRDRYEAYYAERLWNLLPGIYRSLDSDDDAVPGPLRELVGRVGTQMAVVRRSIDRTWEDQSIEGCDDWLIPYIGEMLATNIVAGLDARAQRLDVARTIYYRRRKGTLAILEEITANITGWNARAVEFFTRLARTRHLFDPEIGVDPAQAVIEGLRGARSLTARGGFADLRHATAAAESATAFDEFHHTADFRRGADRSGWHGIPKLGIFLWRLKSFDCPLTTPVEHALCPGQFTFDPTGREIPLFADDVRDKDQYGDAWVTPDEWMLPTPIGRPLFVQESARLYPNSLAVLRVSGPLEDVLPLSAVEVHPDRGRLRLLAPLPAGAVPRVRYHYGFSSEIGAGPYDRRALGETLPAVVTPLQPPASGGGNALATALAGLPAPATATVPIADSLTYAGPADIAAIENLLLQSGQNQRPVVRRNGSPWVLTGASATARLTIDGLLLSGGDIVLRGQFDTVELFCTTLDPGEALDASGAMPRSLDDRPLVPTTLWIEGIVTTLRLRRTIAGPIRTRGPGKILRIELVDSIAQAVRTTAFGAFAAADIADPRHLAIRWKSGNDPLTTFLRGSFAAPLQAALTAYNPATQPDAALIGQLVGGLNAAQGLDPLYTVPRFAHLPLPPDLVAAAQAGPTGPALARVNRLLLEAAYPVALAAASVASVEAELSLERSTCLGSVFAHRISASESLMAGFARASDIQHGCVRFSGYGLGSRLHQPYESVALRGPAALFVSQRFGDPGYAQLSRYADREIVNGDPGASVLAGAQDGSEMGAFARERNAVKERGLQIKLREFMPVGLTPVLIYAT